MIGIWSLWQRIGRLVMDWRIGDGLEDWGWIGELVMDWQIGTEFALDRQIGDGLADLPRNGIGLVKDY